MFFYSYIKSFFSHILSIVSFQKNHIKWNETTHECFLYNQLSSAQISHRFKNYNAGTIALFINTVSGASLQNVVRLQNNKKNETFLLKCTQLISTFPPRRVPDGAEVPVTEVMFMVKLFICIVGILVGIKVLIL